MKRLICLLLSIVMMLGILSGCGSGKSGESIVPTVQEESSEIQLLLEQDWVPEAIKQNLDETILWNEMLDMLANIIVLCDASGLENWNAIVRSKDDAMQRDDGMLAIYEAACVLDIGHKARDSWGDVNIYYVTFPEYNNGYNPNSSAFTNVRDTAPFADRPGQQAGWDYLTSARFYSMGISSVENQEPFFEYSDEDTHYADPLTRREAITAAAKLKLAYETAHSGGYTIPETNWDDPLLAEAKTACETILNSPTTITKGETLVLGETYTGTAYYVSNSGNDNADGLSPETAWATLNKVEKANLKYGDAVFFERGGTWYGTLKMQYGVTYSAYAEGAKPIITGAVRDAAQPEKWTLYAETADGGKIWQYVEETEDCGVILLNGGEVVARKAYPLWNEKEYINNAGEHYVVENELENLMFFSALNLSGKYAKIGTRLDESGVKGSLFLRCDAGNPGDVWDNIEMFVVPVGTITADKGWNTIDNLHFRGFSVSAMDCNNHSNIVYQNCEADWCGGGITFYHQIDGRFTVSISGGGLLLFGHDVTGRNNYIHDCENKGIAIVINGAGAAVNPTWLNRTNILVEGNVVERCGSSVYMWVDVLGGNASWKYEDITFRSNYFVNGNYGWRQRNMLGLDDYNGPLVNFNNVRATGPVSFENNLFYRTAGVLVKEDDSTEETFKPIMQGNTYVQDKDQMLYVKQEPNNHYAALANSDQTQMETVVREYMGDATGKIIILE